MEIIKNKANWTGAIGLREEVLIVVPTIEAISKADIQGVTTRAVQLVTLGLLANYLKGGVA
jgi:hypothetical protein